MLEPPSVTLPRLPFFAVALALALAGCSTRVPISISAPRMPPVNGFATTTIYTGSFGAGGCSGQFTGTPGSDTAAAAMGCSDGRRGSGTVMLVDGQVASGAILLNDGSTARIARRPSEIQPVVGRPWELFGPVIDLYDWGTGSTAPAPKG